jgi:hypothetical protein
MAAYVYVDFGNKHQTLLTGTQCFEGNLAREPGAEALALCLDLKSDLHCTNILS